MNFFEARRLILEQSEEEYYNPSMYIVYILASKKYADRYYIGVTQDIKRRLAEHNDEKSPYSSKYGPWGLRTYIAFNDRRKAKEFERYLKSGSGFAFLKKRLL